MPILLVLFLLGGYVIHGLANQTGTAAIHRRYFSGGEPGAITAAITRGEKNIVIEELPIDVNYVRAAASEQQIRLMGCDPDMTVLVGSVRSGGGAPTEDMGLVYSDWNFDVSDVLRSPASAKVRPGDRTSMLHKGGRTVVNGRSVTALRYNRTMMEVGRRYLIFAPRSVPVTHALVTDLHGFDLTVTPKPLSDYPFQVPAGLSASELVMFVKDALRGCRS